jgi:hypothetical protein
LLWRRELRGWRELREKLSFTEIIVALLGAHAELLGKSGADVKFLRYMVVTGFFI